MQEGFLQRIRYAMKPDEAYGLIFSWDVVVNSYNHEYLVKAIFCATVVIPHSWKTLFGNKICPCIWLICT